MSLDPLKHGSLPIWAAKLFIDLDLGDIATYPQRADLQNALTKQLEQIKTNLEQEQHKNVVFVRGKLWILAKMANIIICPRNSSTQNSCELVDCVHSLLRQLAKVSADSDVIAAAFCALHEYSVLPGSKFIDSQGKRASHFLYVILTPKT